MNDIAAKPPAIIESRGVSIRKRCLDRKAAAALQEILDGTHELETELIELKASMAGDKGDDERRRVLGFTRAA